MKKNLLWITLLSFGTFSTWVLWNTGYFGIWQAGFTDPASLQILLDLVICCLIITSWLIRDARARGISPTPWLVGTLTTGSIALLVYLLVREYKTADNRNLEAAV